MDSFYDAPRCAPTPTEIKNFLATPVVPEVSIICPSKTPQNHYMPYNDWRAQQKLPDNILTSNRENILKSSHNLDQPINFTSQQNTSQLMKKQVRFESPVLHQRPLLTYEKYVPKNGSIPKHCGNENKVLANQQNIGPIRGRNNFEQIYMANIPKRELDLSVIDLPKHIKTPEHISGTIDELDKSCSNNSYNHEKSSDSESTNKENVETQRALPKTYREFLEAQKKTVKSDKPSLNDSVTDIFNYKKHKPVFEHKEKPQNEHRKESPKFNRPIQNIFPPIVNNQYQHTQRIHSQSQLLQRSMDNPTYTAPINHYNNLENKQYHEERQPLHSPKCDSVTQTSTVFLGNIALNNIPESAQTENKNDEPSNKDLLKIIAQQNEQLLLLQKQVGMLLNRDQNQAKPIEAPPRYMGEKLISSTQNENFRQDGTPKKRGMSKFSIDLMTSFEVAIRPQHNKQNFMHMEPKIQEITESESSASGLDRDEKVVEQSLYLPEPVREMCPSPEPSININMQDYDSSDEDVTASEIGATFYQNLMGQVNNILKKAHFQTREDLAAKDEIKATTGPQQTKEKKMNKVKEATIKHLKSIGVTVDPLDESDESSTSSRNDSKDYTPSEISFAIKQMLMKYLPDDQLAKLAYSAPEKLKHRNGKPGVIPPRPEFSFASVQYMKKYNLLPSHETKRNGNMQMHKPTRQQADNLSNPKILDLTALKMQPKLL